MKKKHTTQLIYEAACALAGQKEVDDGSSLTMDQALEIIKIAEINQIHKDCLQISEVLSEIKKRGISGKRLASTRMKAE